MNDAYIGNALSSIPRVSPCLPSLVGAAERAEREAEQAAHASAMSEMNAARMELNVARRALDTEKKAKEAAKRAQATAVAEAEEAVSAHVLGGNGTSGTRPQAYYPKTIARTHTKFKENILTLLIIFEETLYPPFLRPVIHQSEALPSTEIVTVDDQ